MQETNDPSPECDSDSDDDDASLKLIISISISQYLRAHVTEESLRRNGIGEQNSKT